MEFIDKSIFSEYGYYRGKKNISTKLVLEAHAWLLEIEKQGKSISDKMQPQYDLLDTNGSCRVRKLRRLYWYDELFWNRWLSETGIFELAKNCVGEGAALINHASFMKPAGVGTAVVPHQDQTLWPFKYPNALSIWIALTDANRANGCLKIWPGSHNLGELEHSFECGDQWHKGIDVSDLDINPIDVPLQAGGYVAWDRYTVHSSSENKSDSDRVGIVMVFADASIKPFYAPDSYVLEQ